MEEIERRMMSISSKETGRNSFSVNLLANEERGGRENRKRERKK